jgi:hypothetical protein
VSVAGAVEDSVTAAIIRRVASLLHVHVQLTSASSGEPIPPAAAAADADHLDPAAATGAPPSFDVSDEWDSQALACAIRDSSNGQMLRELGLEEDFDVILDVDRYAGALPIFHADADAFALACLSQSTAPVGGGGDADGGGADGGGADGTAAAATAVQRALHLARTLGSEADLKLVMRM